jgi:hypothetical protein
MSDPVENVEIEDVLSSIRRLVSADERESGAPRPLSRDNVSETAKAPDAAPAPENDAGSDKASDDDKLVLTDALRVDKGATHDPAPAAEHTEAQAEADEAADWEILEDDDAGNTAFGGEEDDAEGWDEIEDAEFVDVTAQEDEGPSGEEDKPDTKLPEFLRHSDMNKPDTPKEADSPDASAETSMDVAKDDVEDDAFFDADAPDAWDASLARDDAAEEEQLGDIDALQSRIEKMSAAFDDLDEPYDPEPGSADANAASEAADPLPWAEMDAAEAAIAARESLDAAPDEALTEDTGPEITAAENPAPEKAATAAAAGAAVGTARGDEPRDETRGEDLLGEDAVIDEEMLRDMVAEIVRQELQGALGERITRNVRKLVRREINRALMSQGIE